MKKPFRVLRVGLIVVGLIGCSTPRRPESRSDTHMLSVDTPFALEARRTLLNSPRPGDESLRELLALRILAKQDPTDGSWNHDPTATGEALLQLHALHLLSKDDPAVRKAVSFLLGREIPLVAYTADSPAWGRGWVGLYSLILWGFGEELKVAETVRTLLDNLDKWLDGKDGRTACAILRCVTAHPLLKDPERRELILARLAQRQLPGGWDLGPGTDNAAVLEALLPLADEPRARLEILRFLPNAVCSEGINTAGGILDPEESHLVVLKALKVAGLLELYRKLGPGIQEYLDPYRLGLYVVAREGEQGPALRYGETTVVVRPEPVLLGTEIRKWRAVVSPEPEKGPLLTLTLSEGAKEKLKSLLAADSRVKVALILGDRVLAVRPLVELIDPEGIAVRGLALEESAALMKAVSTIEQAGVTPLHGPASSGTVRGGSPEGTSTKKESQ